MLDDEESWSSEEEEPLDLTDDAKSRKQARHQTIVKPPKQELIPWLASWKKRRKFQRITACIVELRASLAVGDIKLGQLE